MIAFLILFIIMCLIGTRKNSGTSISEPLSPQNVCALRGIMAIEIVLGHTYGARNGTELLYLNDRIGIWPVGVFLFLSGYGLMYSLHHKKDYLKDFFKKRIIKRVFFPYVLVFFIRYALVYGQQNVVKVFAYDLLSNWFVTEIIIIYILWRISYTIFNEKHALGFLLIIILIFNAIGCWAGISTRWYASTACFVLGIILEKIEPQMYLTIYKKYIIVAISIFFLVLCSVLFLCIGDNNSGIMCVCMNVTCISVCVIVYLVLSVLSIGNEMTLFWGENSWEIYLLHPTILYCMKNIEINNIFVWMVLYISGISIAAWCIHQFIIGRK